MPNVTSHTAATAHRETAARFNRIHWAVFDNFFHDDGDGDDVYLRAGDDEGFVTSLIVGAQIKGGENFFRSVKWLDNAKTIPEGWWYTFEERHLEYWLTNPFPWLLILYNIETQQAHWVLVKQSALSPAPRSKGTRILVPATQTIDESNRKALWDAATSKSGDEFWESSQWSIGLDQIGPRERLRSALIAPHLVVPPRGEWASRELLPEEAIAVLVTGGLPEYEQAAQSGSTLPKLTDDPSALPWAWQFVVAVGLMLKLGRGEPLEASLSAASQPDEVAAAAVVYSCLCARLGDPDVAARTLTEVLCGATDLQKTDKAWLCVQLSRHLYEVGDLQKATEFTEEATVQLKGENEKDPSVVVLRASAVRLGIRLTGQRTEQSDRTLRRARRSVSWWRTDAVAAALEGQLDEAFEVWSSREINRFQFKDLVAANLTRAELAADHAGEHETVLGIQAATAKRLVLDGHNDEVFVEALRLLRRSGDHKALKSLVLRMLFAGPISGLPNECAASLQRRLWTHSSALSILTLWSQAGALMKPEDALAAARICIGLASGDAADLIERIQPNFVPEIYALEAVEDLVAALDESGTIEVAKGLLSLAQNDSDGTRSTYLSRVVRYLKIEHLQSTDVAEWINMVRNSSSKKDQLTRAVLGRFASGNAEAQQMLLARVNDGDSLSAFEVDWSSLEPSHVEALASDFTNRLRKLRDESRQRIYSQRQIDPLAALTHLVVQKDLDDCWPHVLDALCDPDLPVERKGGALELFAADVDRLPAERREELARIFEELLVQSDGVAVPFESSAEPQIYQAARVFQVIDDDTFLAKAAQLLRSTDRKERRAGADMLVVGVVSEGTTALLAGLLGETDPKVCSRAAKALGGLAALTEKPGTLLKEAFDACAASDGVLVPIQFLVGYRAAVREGHQPSNVRYEEHLLNHVSGHLRTCASEIAALRSNQS